MPVVIPTLDSPQQRVEPLRTPSTPNPSPDAFGARMGEAIQTVGQVAADIAQNERQKANYAAETDAQNAVDSYYNQEIAPLITKTKGKDALGLPEKVGPMLKSKMSEIYAGLSNDEQKLSFDRWSKRYMTDQQRGLTTYIDREYSNYETETYTSFLNNSVNSAAQKAVNGDVAGIAVELEEQARKIETRGALNGEDPEKIKAVTARYETDTHLAVINNLLAFDKYSAAKNYFEANKGNIEGTRVDQAKNALDSWKQSFDNRRDAILTKSVNEAVDVLEAGETPPELETLKALTPSNPELDYKLRSAEQDKDFAGELYKARPSQQQAAILTLESKATKSKRDVERLERGRKIHADTVQLLEKDPTSLIRKNKLTPVLPVDVEDPGTFIQRQNVRDTALKHYGKTTHGLDSREIDGITLRLNQNNTDQNMSYLARLRTTADDTTYELVLSEAAKGRADLLIAGGLVSDNPTLAEAILKGRDIARTNPKSIPETSSPDVMTEIDDYIGAALPAGVKSQIAEAALYAELQTRKDGKLDKESFDASNYAGILERLTGGVFEYNDKKTLSPIYGMEESDFDDMMDKISDSDLVGAHTMDPTLNTGRPFGAKELKSSGTLTYVRDGVYWIETGSGVVWGRDNKPFELNLKALYPKLISQKSGAELLQ